jgi:hypothetical protein
MNTDTHTVAAKERSTAAAAAAVAAELLMALLRLLQHLTRGAPLR